MNSLKLCELITIVQHLLCNQGHTFFSERGSKVLTLPEVVPEDDKRQLSYY